jgi:hypothetical protein
VIRPVFIRSPKLGVLNLLGSEGEALLAEDLKTLTPLFGRPVTAAAGSPTCDVLLVYCTPERNGDVVGAESRLIELLKTSRARVAVLGSKNPGDAYFAATKGAEQAGLNLVLTVDRRGARFAPFLKKLFSEMFLGTPMPLAWEKLAPQTDPHAECPNATFRPSGSIAFQ